MYLVRAPTGPGFRLRNLMATYNYITAGALAQQVSNRLYDPQQQFWPQAELLAYLNEALQTWTALTGYWRNDFTFPAVANTCWYDLTAVANSLCAYSVTDVRLYTLIQYHLLEPAVGINPWTGVSTQFSASDILEAVQRRRNELLSVTGCTLTRRLVPATPGRITLPDSVTDIRRMAYLPVPIGIPYGFGQYGVGPYGSPPPFLGTPVWPEDSFGEMSFNQSYLQSPAATPSTYLQSTQPPISFDTDVPPAFGGSYELITSESGTPLSVTTPSLLSVPDNWAHIIKWGGLADLFSRESNAKDLPRAEYCNQRYQMGLHLLSTAPQLLQLRVNNVPLQLDAVVAADLYQTGWQSIAPGSPAEALTAGLNLIALNPVPDGGTYTLTATVVQSAPLPASAAALVQVSRDDLDCIIDYVQHLAAVKLGGKEFQSTIPLFKRFLKQAATYGLKLQELGEYTSVIYGQSGRQSEMAPLLSVAEGSPVEAD